jgi:hypothetical protein
MMTKKILSIKNLEPRNPHSTAASHNPSLRKKTHADAAQAVASHDHSLLRRQLATSHLASERTCRRVADPLVVRRK